METPEPITWSRNFDDEEIPEDEAIKLPHAAFELYDAAKQYKVDGKIKTKTLIVGSRIAASVLLHATFESKTALGEIKLDNFSSSHVELRQHFINHKVSKLFSISAFEQGSFDVLILICQNMMPAESTNAFVKALFQHVEASQTIIFDTIPASTYLSGVRHDVPCMRRVCTEAMKEAHAGSDWEATEDKLAPFLEAPVLIERLPAALLQYCQLRDQKAVAYISLESDLYLESPTIIAWEPILKHYLHNHKLQSSISYNSLLKNVVTHRPNPLFT